MVMFNADEIRKLRLGLGMSLADFAERLGVTVAAVSRWETGNRHPRYETLEKLNEIARGAGRKKVAV